MVDLFYGGFWCCGLLVLIVSFLGFVDLCGLLQYSFLDFWLRWVWGVFCFGVFLVGLLFVTVLRFWPVGLGLLLVVLIMYFLVLGGCSADAA